MIRCLSVMNSSLLQTAEQLDKSETSMNTSNKLSLQMVEFILISKLCSSQ